MFTIFTYQKCSFFSMAGMAGNSLLFKKSKKSYPQGYPQGYYNPVDNPVDNFFF